MNGMNMRKIEEFDEYQRPSNVSPNDQRICNNIPLISLRTSKILEMPWSQLTAISNILTPDILRNINMDMRYINLQRKF